MPDPITPEAEAMTHRKTTGGKRLILLLLVLVLGLAGACGVMLWFFFDSPLLTWQHAAELADPLAAAAPGARIQRVIEYTETCSVVRAISESGYVFTALLYKADGAWQVFAMEGQAGLAPALTWGQVCGGPNPLAPLELPPALPLE